MNQVPAAPASAAITSATDPSKRAWKVIEEIDRHLLTPIREADAVWRSYPESFSTALRANEGAGSVRRWLDLNHDADKMRAGIEGALEKIMPRELIVAYIETQIAALSARPSRNRSGLCIGRLIDSFPNARPHNPAVYRENLVHMAEIDGVSPTVVALACDAIMRDPLHEFLPAPAAFIAACEKARTSLSRAQSYGWTMLRARHRLENDLAELTEIQTGVTCARPDAPDPKLAPADEKASRVGFV